EVKGRGRRSGGGLRRCGGGSCRCRRHKRYRRQGLPDGGDGDVELATLLALGAAGVAHREGQAAQVRTAAQQGLQEGVGLLPVQVVDLGDGVRGLGEGLVARQVPRRGFPEGHFRDLRQVLGEQRHVLARDHFRGNRQQVFQRRLRVDFEVETREFFRHYPVRRLRLRARRW